MSKPSNPIAPFHVDEDALDQSLSHAPMDAATLLLIGYSAQISAFVSVLFFPPLAVALFAISLAPMVCIAYREHQQ